MAASRRLGLNTGLPARSETLLTLVLWTSDISFRPALAMLTLLQTLALHTAWQEAGNSTTSRQRSYYSKPVMGLEEVIEGSVIRTWKGSVQSQHQATALWELSGKVPLRPL